MVTFFGLQRDLARSGQPQRGQRLDLGQEIDRNQPAQRPDQQQRNHGRDHRLAGEDDGYRHGKAQREQQRSQRTQGDAHGIDGDNLDQGRHGNGGRRGADGLQHADLRHLLQRLDLEKAADDQDADEEREVALGVERALLLGE